MFEWLADPQKQCAFVTPLYGGLQAKSAACAFKFIENFTECFHILIKSSSVQCSTLTLEVPSFSSCATFFCTHPAYCD